MTKVRYTSYSNVQKSIVENGLEAVKDVLLNGEKSEKSSILLCLDKYFDTYYGLKLEYKELLIDFLQDRLFSNEEIEIKEDILFCYAMFLISWSY